MSTLALIDYDIVVYSAGFQSQQSVVSCKGVEYKNKTQALKDGCKEEDLEVKVYAGPLSHALSNAKKLVQKIVDSVGASDYVGFLTGAGNFREEIATIKPYKGNRTQEKPVHYHQIKEYLTRRHNGTIVCGMEADDMMGIEQYKTWDEGNTVICSKDKDLKQIPGRHFNWADNNETFVQEWEGIKFFYTQLLTGDMVDNIRGVPGIGKTKATKLLKDCSNEFELYNVCLEAYKKAEIENELLETARLLWIHRTYPLIPWVPPTE